MSVDRKCRPGALCGALNINVGTEREKEPVFGTEVKLNGMNIPQKINFVGIRS